MYFLAGKYRKFKNTVSREAKALLHPKIKAILHPMWLELNRDSARFLRHGVNGIIHVGANTGQEREIYRNLGLNVIWIEPIPEVFDQLVTNIRGFENQVAIQALITDVDDKQYSFHVSNNNGASSSILDLKYHKDLWPEIGYDRTITLQGITLASLLKKQRIDPNDYQALIIDTQGTEILALSGSLPILKHLEFIKIEVADFEAYEGCCQISDVDYFMNQHGFKEMYRRKFARRGSKGGCYFDVVYKKILDN